MAQAEVWKVVTSDQHREPPLVCAEAVGSPATAARGSRVSGLSGTIRRFRSELTPIPLVLFPADRLGDPWTYASLAHEASGTTSTRIWGSSPKPSRPVANASPPPAWTRNGATAGRAGGPRSSRMRSASCSAGRGFATGLASWLQSVALADVFANPNADRHPLPHVRLRLLEGLFRASSIPAWIRLANELAASLAGANVPALQRPFEEDAAPFAEAVLCTQLSAFKGHAIADLAPDLAGDAAITEQLSTFMRTGIDRTPTPQGPPAFPDHSFPLPRRSRSARARATAEQSESIKKRTLEYIVDIPRPQFLAAPPLDRREHMRALARNLNVRLVPT